MRHTKSLTTDSLTIGHQALFWVTIPPAKDEDKSI